MGTTAGAAAVAAVLFLVLLQAVLSAKSLLFLLHKSWRWLDERCHVYKVYKIPRFVEGGGGDGNQQQENPLFKKAMVYINSLPSLEDSDCANIFSTGRKPNDFFLQPDPGRPVSDSFLGRRLSWSLCTSSSPSPPHLSLRMRCHDRGRVLRPYLHHVETIADDIESRRKELKLFFYTRSPGRWSSVPLSHPSTFETVAVDAELKSRVRSDLEAFLKGKSYYARIGRVWKRSYLLHGPPGTGKSSFAVAMARFLNYDVYDVDLSRASKDPAELRSLLVRTGPRSVILFEDLDRYLSSGDKEESITAAMMRFVDGVLSCCGAERLIVFTMSGGEIDSTVVELPGRLDMHVRFPLCDFSTFKTLASSHLGLKDHKLYPQVEEGFQNGSARLSPAEVGEMMIANRGSPSRAMKTVINALHRCSSPSAMLSSRSLRKAPSESGSIKASGPEENEAYESPVCGFGKDYSTVRELRNLYGLIRRRGSGSRKEGTMSVEMAAAAAAAANAAATANAANYLDRSFERGGL